MSDNLYTANIRAILARHFGDNFTTYTLPEETLQVTSSGEFKPAEIDLTSDSDGVGLLGLPIWSNVVFPDGQYTYNGVQVNYSGLKLLDCLVDVSVQKTIISTPIAGRRGTVKELISIGDYAVTIKGVLVSKDRYKEPDAEIRQLKALFEVPAALEVECKLLSRLSIYSLVFQSLNLPKQPGTINVQPFEISAVSDLPVELLLNEEEGL